MTELDIALKAASRRLLWRMGYSTRIDVPLRAIQASTAAGRGKGRSSTPESFTDLDVLGVSIDQAASVRSSIVDCKTGGASTISRMFWVRGLQDFFEADDAFIVRDRAISRDARQLANRLGLTALSSEEVTAIESLHPVDLPLEIEPLALLFDPDEIARVMVRSTGLDARLHGLMEYRQFDYWVYPEHLNMMKMIEVLKSTADHLDVSNPIHTGIVLDCAWLYVLSSAHALHALRAVHISDLSAGLSEYLAGGPSQLRQKRDIFEILSRLQQDRQIPESVRVGVNPAYFDGLLELLTRLLRRNTVLTPLLRLLEFQSTMAIAGRKVSTATAFGSAYDRVAAKLAIDVVSFLVSTAGLHPGFVVSARTLLGDSGGVAGDNVSPSVDSQKLAVQTKPAPVDAIDSKTPPMLFGDE